MSDLSLEDIQKLEEAGAPAESEQDVAEQRKVAIFAIKKSALAAYQVRSSHLRGLAYQMKCQGYLDGLNYAFDVIFEQILDGPIELNVVAVEKNDGKDSKQAKPEKDSGQNAAYCEEG